MTTVAARLASAQLACTSGACSRPAARPAAAAATCHRRGFAGQPLGGAPQQQQLWALPEAQHRRQRQWGRRSAAPLAAAAAGGAAPSSSTVPALDSLEILPILSIQGYVSPEVPEGTEASVVAVYDESKTLQYVGFSRGLRETLRTLFSRRPEKAHYYRALHLPKLDQQQMIDVRAAWFDGNYGPPPGNKLPHERDQWQQPLEAHTISERGKAQAAVELAKVVQQRIVQRGCKEEFVAKAELLEEGKVDFMPAAALTAEELERQRAAAELAAKSTRTVAFEMEGAPASFDLFYKHTYPTNGGFMFDVTITFQDKETTHRVIVGRPYYEPQGVTPQTTLERAFAFLLRKKVPRQTEGMLLSSQFSSNYFSISQVEQSFEEFGPYFAEQGGALPGSDAFWRFNRTQDYGNKGVNETAEQLKATFS